MTIEAEVNRVLERLKQNKRLSCYVDWSLPVPRPHYATGTIKLVIVGQDPTLGDPKRRKEIKTALELNREGELRKYINCICAQLNLNIDENVYATNLYKNFFVKKPTDINKKKKVNIFEEFIGFWLPLLQYELEPFEGLPIITLGEPILKQIVCNKVTAELKWYWGRNSTESFKYIPATDNQLNQVIYPFPHYWTKKRHLLYKTKIQDYTAFVKSIAFS